MIRLHQPVGGWLCELRCAVSRANPDGFFFFVMRPDPLTIKRLVRELREERNRSDHERTATCRACEKNKCGYAKCEACLLLELWTLWKLK